LIFFLMLEIDCPTFLPPWICEHWDVLLYLAPSLILAVIFRTLARCHSVFFSFYLSGTILHEIAHLLVGFLTNARPVNFSVIPRRTVGNQWILGSVSFANLRWYNAAFVGLAPVLVLLVPILVALVRLHIGTTYDWLDVVIAVLIAPAYLSFLPSRIDVLVALRSWPYLALAGIFIWWSWH
jgi:hypothetical protein